MQLKNYIRASNGAIRVVDYPSGKCLMIDTRLEYTPEDWDKTITQCYELGYELRADEPDNIAGPWEFWHMYPIPEVA
jgi:hypothetical protein